MVENSKRNCIMPSCKGDKIELVHKFPRNDTRAREWLDIINLPELNNLPIEKIRKSKFICTRHFASNAYKHTESRSLNITAVPSLNLKTNLDKTDHILRRIRKRKNIYKIMDTNMQNEDIQLIVEPQNKIHDSKMQIVELASQELSNEEIEILSTDQKMLEEIPKNIDTNSNSQTVEEYQDDDFIEIYDTKFPGGIRVNYFWLRDHCMCQKCYIKNTSHRKFNFLDVDENIRPQSYDLYKNLLRVKWQDDHESSYELDFLYNSQYHIKRAIYEKSLASIWNQEIIKTSNYARVALNDLLCFDATVKNVLESLIKYGVAFVENVPATQHSTEMTITRLFPLMKTFFGEMWTYSDTNDHADFVCTNNFLPAHNDNTYFNDAAGLQVLHCIQHKGEGGENFLIDGYYIANVLKNSHPEIFERLTKYQVPAQYIKEGRHHSYIAPIIKINPLTNSVEQIRFNINDRAILDTIPFDQVSHYYKDLRILASQIQNKANEWSFKLRPGTVLIYDNWRILHGRKEYTGKRVMTGAYVSRTEFLSAARVANVIK